MPHERRPRPEAAALFDMLQAAQATLRHVRGKSWEDYEHEEMLRHAVDVLINGQATRVGAFDVV